MKRFYLTTILQAAIFIIFIIGAVGAFAFEILDGMAKKINESLKAGKESYEVQPKDAESKRSSQCLTLREYYNLQGVRMAKPSTGIYV